MSVVQKQVAQLRAVHRHTTQTPHTSEETT